MDSESQDKHLGFYRLSPEETMAQLGSTMGGLTAAEAQKRLAEHGKNVFMAGKKTPPVVRYLRQFKDMMIVLLLASALLSFWMGDARTGAVLIALVLFNTGIGFFQEFKAEKTIEMLEKLIVTQAKVLRGDQWLEIDSAELVPGDIVQIEAGDSVPADLRVLTEDELSTNDFALTGESNPTRKFKHAISAAVPLAGRQNICFMGTTTATGKGTGVVVGTGMNTEIGRIASLSQAAPDLLSPLQREMNNMASKVTWGTLVLCTLLLPVAIAAHLAIKDAVLFAIGIASSLIPQGLPAEINTSLAGASARLARARALVKKLSAVETLGATNVILTDKTGTLTRNQMTVEHVLIGTTEYSVTGGGYEANGVIKTTDDEQVTADRLQQLQLFFKTGVLANNAKVNAPDDEHAGWYCVGDPTEGALLTLARKAGLDTAQVDQQHPEQKEYAFDSARKRMSSVRIVDGELWLFVKGAPESVAAQSTYIWDNGTERLLQADDQQFLQSYNEAHAAMAQRNLAYAYRRLPQGFDPLSEHLDAAEHDLTFLGIVSMVDPLRDEVPAAMDAARRARMHVSIITGDFAVTARAIAVRARLADKPEDLTVVEGEDLPGLSDEQVLNYVRKGGAIFSRVAPEDKLRIVELAEKNGLIVAVTGDGINDAPALKSANIGVAMGVTGTDVAKQSADIILLDDSFHTLVGAVQEGRVIFQNIQKGTLSSFTSNIAELVVSLSSLAAAALFAIPLGLSVMQILAIDLIAELFPIASLGNDPAEGDLMDEAPRDSKRHILNRGSMLDILHAGVIMGAIGFANYLLFYWRHGVSAGSVTAGSDLHMAATAMTYLTVVLVQLSNILQRRSHKGIFTRYQFSNWHFWAAIALSLTCVLLIIYSPLNFYFAAAPLAATDWLWAFAAVVIFIALREPYLRWRRKARG